jgi:tRNA uridine 5-carboxymethylaminomethyl modification enzyme
MVAFFKATSVSVGEANLLWNRKRLLITQGDKMFKVFSRPQIDLEDILNLTR